ncbi:MAG: SCO family protein [Bacteroidia bacterium]|nr:SCO family protein [Bacteroidia bacterium]NND09674.1 SCO family protein [Flavobacteriaceae bacterium]NNK27299.1 SCO family protein [Flavobacteriaceae bacterium]RZV56962.1 MAG: SCO family protein [Flavobacteriaceae bacterium]
MKKTNYSYIGISFIILVFGIIFVPRIVDRISNDEITKKNRLSQTEEQGDLSDLAFIIINGEPKKVPDFEFTNQNGVIITQDDYKDKVFVAEFFFTTCPTICPIMNTNLVQIQEQFKNFEDFGVASFTINPEYDTVEILKEYADNYGISNPNWHLMTGKEEQIYSLANSGFNLYAAIDADAEGGFEHSGYFALIDKKGFFRSRKDDFGNPKVYYRGTITENQRVNEDGEEEEISLLKEDIAKLLKEQ